MKYMLTLLIFINASAVSADNLTVHTVSHHFITQDMNNVNPGLGYDVNKNLRIGGFYNSYEKPSFCSVGIANITDKFRVGVGVISGYKLQNSRIYEGKHTSLIPLIAMEYDITSDVSIAWFGEVLNLELKF
jgi:hypothetical protein